MSRLNAGCPTAISNRSEAEGELVGAKVGGGATGLLRTHVGNGARPQTRVGLRLRVGAVRHIRSALEIQSAAPGRSRRSSRARTASPSCSRASGRDARCRLSVLHKGGEQFGDMVIINPPNGEWSLLVALNMVATWVTTMMMMT